MDTVRVRFAPSPTGHLHIGGVRTALFNWAFARHHKGVFVLRIDDTDQARSSDSSMLGILQDFQWLGIDWDEGPSPDNPLGDQMGQYGPYFQSQRLELYNKYIDSLLQSGFAYECFLSQEEIAGKKKDSISSGGDGKYKRDWALSLTEAEKEKRLSEGIKPVVRFKMPEHSISFDDLACGHVQCAQDEFEDFIIRRSDGYPTYHLASVVDDELMKITHILRGQEHRTNTFRHIALQQALGFNIPKYCHFSLIFNPDGSKMSKRDKAKAARAAANEYIKSGGSIDNLLVTESIEESLFSQFLSKKNDSIDIATKIAQYLELTLPEIDVYDYRNSGYSPEPLLNYLSLLGWNPGDDVEKFDIDFMIDKFDLTRIGTSNSKFDRKKLISFNADHIHNLSDEDFEKLFVQYADIYYPGFANKIGNITLFCKLYKKRSNTLKDPIRLGGFLASKTSDIEFAERSVNKVLFKNEKSGLRVLEQVKNDFERITIWNAETITNYLSNFCEANQIGMKKVAQPIRVAISGNVVTPEISETLKLLGKDKTIERLQYCLTIFSKYEA